MQEPTRHTLRRAAALLVGGCAALLVSCDSKTSVANDDGVRNMMTQQSEDLTVILSRNGNLTYRFTTPLLERYEYALEPYTEFRKGIHIETYNDSTHQVESSLTANYAILLEKQQLWEAKGNVRGHNAGGNQLETEQLFWNQKSKLVYSNVDSKITQNTDVVYGDGFESDERFEEFVVRNPKGKVTVETAPNRSETGRAGGRAGDPRGRRRGQSGHDPQPAQTTGRTPYARQAGQTRTVRPSGPPGSRRSRKPPSLKAPPPDSPARRTGKGRLIRARETLRQINCCIFAAGGCRAERTFSPRALRRRHLRFR